MTQSDDEDPAAKVTDVTDLTRSSDDEEPAAKVTDLTQSSDDEEPAAKVTDLMRSSDDEDPAAAEAKRNAAAAAEAERKPAAAASYGADSEAQPPPSIIFGQGVLVVDGSTRCRVTNSRSLESAKGQRMVTAAPRQGAAGGAPGGAPGGAAGGAASLGGMKVMLSGDAGDAAASAATESDDHQDEAPIPAMELGKGKQKAADGMGGSAQKRKPNARSAAKPTETEPRAGTTASKKQKKSKWHDTVKRAIKARKADDCPSDSRWMSDVEAWFADKQRHFEWLNIHELEAATVQLMIQMESHEIRDCMEDCLQKRRVELNMHVFNQLLRGGLN